MNVSNMKKGAGDMNSSDLAAIHTQKFCPQTGFESKQIGNVVIRYPNAVKIKASKPVRISRCQTSLKGGAHLEIPSLGSVLLKYQSCERNDDQIIREIRQTLRLGLPNPCESFKSEYSSSRHLKNDCRPQVRQILSRSVTSCDSSVEVNENYAVIKQMLATSERYVNSLKKCKSESGIPSGKLDAAIDRGNSTRFGINVDHGDSALFHYYKNVSKKKTENIIGAEEVNKAVFSKRQNNEALQEEISIKNAKQHNEKEPSVLDDQISCINQERLQAAQKSCQKSKLQGVHLFDMMNNTKRWLAGVKVRSSSTREQSVLSNNQQTDKLRNAKPRYHPSARERSQGARERDDVPRKIDEKTFPRKRQPFTRTNHLATKNGARSKSLKPDELGGGDAYIECPKRTLWCNSEAEHLPKSMQRSAKGWKMESKRMAWILSWLDGVEPLVSERHMKC